jgi:predicted branched-subunit amino acid permease
VHALFIDHISSLAEQLERQQRTTRRPRRRRRHRHRQGFRQRHAELRRGARAMVPFLVGYVPFALVLGSTVAAEGPFLARWAGTALIMAGSAQLVVLQLLDAGAALALVVLAGLVVNARLLVYSASLAADWADASPRFRLAAAAGVIDPTWAVVQERRAAGGRPEDRRAYFAGAAAVLCIGWILLITVGAALGGALDLDATAVAVPLCLLVLVLPRLDSGPGRALVSAAAVVAWFGASLPAGTGVLMAVGAGVAAAAAFERREVRS